MDEGGGIETQEIQESQQIEIPDGKFEAPRDYEIRRRTLEIHGRQQSIDLIKQTSEGNCAEYTALNTAIILRKAGMATNPVVEKYLVENPHLDLATVERKLTIGLLLDAQENHEAFKSKPSDVDNLSRKADYPYEPLTSTNSALLFRAVTSPIHKEFEEDDVVTGDPERALRRISDRTTIAVLIGSRNHATSWIKLDRDYYHIDPYYNDGVVRKTSEVEMKNSIRDSLRQPGSFATLNNLYTK